MSLVLICADLALQDSLTSVTHTSQCRMEQSEVEGRMSEPAKKRKQFTGALVWILEMQSD